MVHIVHTYLNVNKMCTVCAKYYLYRLTLDLNRLVLKT